MATTFPSGSYVVELPWTTIFISPYDDVQLQDELGIELRKGSRKTNGIIVMKNLEAAKLVLQDCHWRSNSSTETPDVRRRARDAAKKVAQVIRVGPVD